jgi:hypothetical protein
LGTQHQSEWSTSEHHNQHISADCRWDDERSALFLHSFGVDSETISKVDMPKLVTSLNQTPIFQWYVVWFGSKNGYQEDMCLREIRLCAHNMITILGSMLNVIGGTYDHLMSVRLFTSRMNKIFI